MKVFTRESLSGGTLLNLTFMKKQNKKNTKINKTLKNDNKTLNMNITTSNFLLLDQVAALPSVFLRKHQIGSSTLHFTIHYEDLKSTL